jgi:thiamine pyrophosphokinase
MDDIYEDIKLDQQRKEEDKARMKAVKKLELRMQCRDFAVQTLVNYKHNEDIEAFKMDSKIVKELYDLSKFHGDMDGLDEVERKSYVSLTDKIEILFKTLKDIYDFAIIKTHFDI